MLNRPNVKQQLELVNMLIRALADEVTLQRAQQPEQMYGPVPVQMEQALYQLRLRKLLMSARVGSGRRTRKATRH